MTLPIGVLTVYAALVIWAVLLVRSVKLKSYRSFLFFGIGLMLFLNIGYVIFGVPASIASFIGIYDVLINLGLAQDGATAVSTCAGNSCTVWGDVYTQHPAWGTAFYDRFANGPQFRSTLLYGHIIFNTIAFVLVHVQLFKPAGRAAGDPVSGGIGGLSHKLLGRITFASLTLSLICAVWLASEHSSVPEYGGVLAEYGFYSMAAFVYGCAIFGIIAIRNGDVDNHRIWMFRLLGSMWGAFWLFRVMLFVIDPLFRNFEAVAILTCIWGSAPLGIIFAEVIRRRLDQPTANSQSTVLPAE